MGKMARAKRPTRPALSETLGLVGVALLLLALNFHGLGTITILGDIEISLADIAVILIGSVWLVYVLMDRLRVSRTLVTAILLASLFAIWVGIQAFLSPEPTRGFTMFLLMLRNIAILCVVGSTLGSIRDLRRLNRVVFLVGVGVAALALVLYLVTALDYQEILTEPARWKPKIIYELDQGGILRLQGFAGDPNFYSLWLSVSLFCGLIVTGVRKFWKWLGIMAIAASIILAFSRGFLIALGVSSLLIVLWLGLVRARTLWRKYAKPIIAGAVAMGIIALVPLPLMQQSATRLLITRFQMTRLTPRFGMWEEILKDLPGQLLLGKGLRSAEHTLEGQYSHNSYLDLLFETGLVGFILWAFFAIFITIRGLGGGITQLMPWVHTWILILSFFLFFSVLYNPFPWLIAAITTNRGR